MGGAFRCQLYTSLHHLPYENLNQLKKRSLCCAIHWWANIKSESKKSNDFQGLSCVYLFVVLPCISRSENVENLREYVNGVIGKVREHAQGVMDKNDHCAGSTST